MKLSITVLLLIFLAAPLAAQETTKPAPQNDPDREHILEHMRTRLPAPLYQDETPEQREARLGTDEDPGPDPDPKKLWHRFGKVYTIQKFPREHASWKGMEYGWVRPMWSVNIPAEIYRETLEHVWVWLEIPEYEAEKYSEQIREFYGMEPSPGAPEKQVIGIPGGEAAAGDFRNTEYLNYTPEQLEFVKAVKPEFTPLAPPSSGVTLRFRESSEGLPQGGSWRNSLAVADMNGDGHLDLVVPPQRGGADSITPYIFLGDGKGSWRLWREVQWPRGYNYGGIAVADLNGDGHQDVVIAAHLSGVFAALGDGKGKFVDYSEGLATMDFPTRRAVLADANRDGRLDIFVISEGPTLAKPNVGSPIRLFMNSGNGNPWKEVEVADGLRQVSGDWMAVGDFNGDRRVDVVGASIYFHGTDLFYLQQKDASWQPFGRGWLPFYSYYTALTSANFSSKKREDVILSFGRFWPHGADPSVVEPPSIWRIVGIERVFFEGAEAKRVPIARWEGTKAVWGLTDGDFNGDSKRDVIYWRPDENKLEVLLGDGKGNFRQADVEGIDLPGQTMYDIRVADVNGDGKDDVILMFEKGNDRVFDGAIRVWLGQGAASPSKTASGGR